MQPSPLQSQAFDFHTITTVLNSSFPIESSFSCNFECRKMSVSIPIDVRVISLLSLPFLSSVCPPCPVQSFPLTLSSSGSSWPECVCVHDTVGRLVFGFVSSLYCSPPFWLFYEPLYLPWSEPSLLLHIRPSCCERCNCSFCW